jgi:glucuronoarabinoxylan endo-1,4-beta-xylanase
VKPEVSAGSCVLLILAALDGCGGGAAADGAGGDPLDVTVSVDVTTTYQTMVGFGAAAAYYANYPAIHPSSAQIYQTIFNDLGLQVLRIGNWYQNDGSSGASLDAGATLVAGALATLGHLPVILMSSWNPPYSTWTASDGSASYGSLKSNGVNDAGGTLTRTSSGGYDYADFGQWWAQSLVAYAAAGVVPDYISIQNEPDFTTTNEGTCLFDPMEDATNAGYGPALDAVRTAITSTPGLALPKLVGPEISGLAGNKLSTYLGGISTSGRLGDLDAVAHHLYSGGIDKIPDSFNQVLTAAATAAGSLPTWMTEYAPSNPDLFETASLIQNSVTVEGVSTYLYWDLFWPASPQGAVQEGLVGIESPTQPSTWQTPNGFFINDSYYAVQHFAKWIGVGWQRVAAASTEDSVTTSAFRSPDGTQLTLVIVNGDGADHQVTVIPGLSDGGASPFGTSAVYRTSGAAERASPLGPLPAGNAFDLPSHGIATVTFGP